MPIPCISIYLINQIKFYLYFVLTCFIVIPKVFSEITVDNPGIWKPLPEKSFLFNLMHFLKMYDKVFIV